MRHISAVPDTFTKVVKVMNHTELWNTKPDTLWIYLYALIPNLWIHTFRST